MVFGKTDVTTAKTVVHDPAIYDRHATVQAFFKEIFMVSKILQDHERQYGIAMKPSDCL